MNLDADALYALLPAVHRARDAEAAGGAGAQAGPLRQLIGLLAEQLTLLDADIDQLYDDQFIETCAPWALPYIGDLVGYQPLRSGGRSVVSRADVANTIGRRRAKGTLRAAEGVARDVSGRDAVAVEYFRRISATQNLNHRRPAVATASLRDALAFSDPGGPFDVTARCVSLGTIATGGLWAIPNVVCWLWPWHAALRAAADPAPVDKSRFAFHPFGIDAPLLNAPAPDADPPSLRDDLPVRLRVRDDPAFVAASVTVEVDGVVQPFAVCDLSDTGPDPATAVWAHVPAPGGLAVDPARGRLAFGTAPTTAPKVTFWHPSNNLLGGGAYSRAAGFDITLAPRIEVGGSGAFATIAAALASLGGTVAGAVEVAGNGMLAAAGLPASIDVAAGRKLEIRALDGSWPVLLPGTPLLLGGGAGSELVLDGFTIAGAGVEVPATIGGAANGLVRLTLRNCTLVPGLSLTRAGGPASPGAVSLACFSPDTVVVLEACILGLVQAEAGGQLRISGCVLDAGATGSPAIAGVAGGAGTTPRAGSLWIYDSTVRGSVAVSLLALGSNTAFCGAVDCAQKQSGIVRFSALPAAYAGPRQYSCAGAETPPLFRSWRVGNPGYARLSASNPDAMLRGADDGGEIGAFHGALEQFIADGVEARLRENTRFGTVSGVRHVQGT